MTVAVALPLSSAPAVRYAVPHHERGEFLNSVSHEERARITELFEAFADMDSRRSLAEGAAFAAGRRRHLGRGWEAKTLSKLHRAFRMGGCKASDWQKKGPRYPAGDWRILLRDYKPAGSRLPEEFLQFWRGIHAEFTGRDDCVSAAWRHLVQEVWFKGKPVAGYGTVDAWCRKHGRALPNSFIIRTADLPDGWTEGNLRRYLPKRQAARKRASQGYLAAHAHEPDMVLGDRSHLLPFGRILFDDVRPDIRALWLSGTKGEIVYPLMVLGLDAASGVDLGNAIKPRSLKDPDNAQGGRHGVSRDMTKLTLCSILRQWGLPPWPITIVHENAAACLDAQTKQLFADRFGDRVQFEATGMFRQRMLAHGFAERGGCPWDKGGIEAFFRVLQTSTAHLPGSTGPRFDTQHGELRAAEAYTLKLLERAGDCQAVIEALQIPGLRWEKMDERLQEALRLLRFRTGHALQGFDHVVEFRLSPSEPWRPEEELATLTPEHMERAEIVRRLESPAERFVKLLRGVQLEPVDPDFLDYVAGERRPVRVRNGRITWSASDRASVPLVFRETGHTLLEDDHEGAEFDAALAPDAGRVILAREGRLCGSVLRQDRVNVADREAVKREAGRVAAARVADRDTLRGYMVEQDTRLHDMQRTNEQLLAAVPLIEQARQQRLQQERQTKAEQTSDAAARQRNRAAQLAALAAERNAPA